MRKHSQLRTKIPLRLRIRNRCRPPGMPRTLRQIIPRQFSNRAYQCYVNAIAVNLALGQPIADYRDAAISGAGTDPAMKRHCRRWYLADLTLSVLRFCS